MFVKEQSERGFWTEGFVPHSYLYEEYDEDGKTIKSDVVSASKK